MEWERGVERWWWWRRGGGIGGWGGGKGCWDGYRGGGRGGWGGRWVGGEVLRRMGSEYKGRYIRATHI